MNTTDVHGTLREMWETRPARPRRDRQVAGVASAVARRYDVDPVLVRVAFVVTAFLGVGGLLYVAGWLGLPEAPDDPAAPGTTSPNPLLLGAVGIGTAIGVGGVFGGGAVLLPTLAALVLLFMLHRSRADRGSPGRVPASPVDGPTAVTGVSLVKETATPTPPAWDPLGAAPFAWDLPEPAAPAPAPVPRRWRPVTPVTLGLALLGGGLTALVLLANGAFSPATLPIVLGVALATVGAGLVVGSFLRTGRGLVPVAVVLGVLTWGVVAAPFDRWQGFDVGDRNIAPASLAELQPRYGTGAGDITLDLRALDLRTGNGEVRTAVSVGAGDVRVVVPGDADVQFTGRSGLGEVSLGEGSSSGPGSVLVATDLGEDGVRSGRLLVLDAEAGAGDVEVRRG